MWTEITRRKHEREGQRYASDVRIMTLLTETRPDNSQETRAALARLRVKQNCHTKMG
jgi:hypothetical protein